MHFHQLKIVHTVIVFRKPYYRIWDYLGFAPTDTNKYTSYSPIDMHNVITGLYSDKIDLHNLFSPSLLVATVVEAECKDTPHHCS